MSSLDPEKANEVRRSSQADSKLSRLTHRYSIKESLDNVSSYYTSRNRILTKNFAGAENAIEYESGEEKFLKPDRKMTGSVNLSKYDFINKTGELSFASALFTFIKVNMVSGFLFLPKGFEAGGWLFSVLTIFVMTLLVLYCFISLCECTDVAYSYSYSIIGYKAAGNLGFYVIEVGICISQISFPCSYSNLITQVVNNMLNYWFNNNDNYHIYIGVMLALIIIPACMLRNINKLAKLHIIGDLAILATIITLAYECISQISSKGDFDLSKLKLINSGWAKLLGMSITSLEGIGVVLPIKESIRQKRKFNWVLVIGCSVVCLVLTVFPLIMYFCYQDNVQEIVLTNLPLEKAYIQAILVVLIFSILIVYPVMLFPSFLILENTLFKKKGESRTSTHQKDRATITKENLLRTFLVLITIVIGIASINRFDTLLALAGCAICTPLALILPSLFHFLLFRKIQSSFRSCCDMLIVIIATMLSVTTLIFTLF